MSYLGVKQIQIDTAVSVVKRQLLHQQPEFFDSLIVYAKQKLPLPIHCKIGLQTGNLSSKQAVVRCAIFTIMKHSLTLGTARMR